MIKVKETGNGVSFAVRVHPRARRNGISGIVGDSIKLDIIAPPIEGRANDACIRFFAELLNVPRSSVTIAAGTNNRNKVIRIAGVTAIAVQHAIEAAFSLKSTRS